jgi:hypothetical protein
MASAASPRIPSRLWCTPASAWISRPDRRWQRWAGRLLLALPLVGLSVWAQYRGFAHPELRLLEHRAGLVRAGGADLGGLRYGYPPLPTLLAIALPDSPLSLSIVTCLCSGVMLWYIAGRLLQRVSAFTTIALLLPIVAVPIMWYAASQLFAQVASLAFLAIALDGFVRFAAHGETEGGFAAGIALALSLCFDPGALMYGLVMCASAPLISHARYRSGHAALAVAAVLFFPVAAVTTGWLFLEWKFSGAFPGSLDYEVGAHLLAFPSGVAGALEAAARSTGTSLLHVPLYFAAGALLYHRRPAAVPGLLLPIAALVTALWLGFAYGGVTAYFMLTILALVTISETASRRFEPALTVVAVGQVALVIAWSPASAYFSEWFRLVT